MSRYYFTPGQDQSFMIRGTAKLLNIASSKYGEDWHSVPHTHNYLELFYIIGGKGQFQIEDQLHSVDAGNLIIINPNVSHTEVSLNAQPLEYIVMGIEGIELAAGEETDGRYNILDCFESVEVSSCLRNVLSEMEQKNAGYKDVCQAYMEILLIHLMRSIDLASTTSPLPINANRQCASVKRYIDGNFKEPLTLEHLAKEAHMNKFYLSHTFKKEYGISPINYMISKRIEESKYLLAETDLSLSQIAQLLGFSSLSYFSQVFHRTQSVSPKEFRKNVKSLQ